jgi:hypothetical protein
MSSPPRRVTVSSTAEAIWPASLLSARIGSTRPPPRDTSTTTLSASSTEAP